MIVSRMKFLLRLLEKYCTCGVLIFLLSYAILSGAQSLTKGELTAISTKLSGKLADTDRVRLLLKISEYEIDHLERITARDSAIHFAKQALELSNKIEYDSGVMNAYLQEIKAWVKIREVEMANEGDGNSALQKRKYVQDMLLVFAKKHGTTEQVGEVYAAIAQFHNRIRINYAELLPLYDSAALWFAKSGHRIRESEMLYHVGFMHNQNGRLKEALPAYHRSIAIVQPEGRPHLSGVYGVLGNTYLFMGGLSLALKYQLQALKMAEVEQDTTVAITGTLHLFLGLTYQALEKPDVALTHLQKAFEIYKRNVPEHPGDISNTVGNMTTIIMKKDPVAAISLLKNFLDEYEQRIGENNAKRLTANFMMAYMLQGNYSEAQRYCDKVLANTARYENPATGLLDYIQVTKFFIASKQYDKARKYLDLSLNIATRQRQNPRLKQIYQSWYKLDSALSDYRSELVHYKLYKAYSDSVLNDVKVKEIAALEIENETEKKEQAIALLTKDAELKQQQLEQSNLMRNSTLVGVVVLLVILVLLANQYRIKRKNNAELQLQRNQIQLKNEALNKMVIEKEWLLKEVHHRTKNNLQTIVSLLDSQSTYLHNTEALAAIQESQNRVHAMSLIHQMFYRSENSASINMTRYVTDLILSLSESFNTYKRIRFEIDVDDIELDISQVIPLGLILNEAITNSIKYAFPGKEEGNVVQVSLKESRGLMSLMITDNGIGFPETFDPGGEEIGLGLTLMKGLCADIEGEFQASSVKGVSIHVTFVATVPLGESANESKALSFAPQ